MRDIGLEKAIEAMGTQNALAERLEITRGAIGQWERVPHERVLEVEKITGIPCWELRPDLYPPDRFSAQRKGKRVGR